MTGRLGEIRYNKYGTAMKIIKCGKNQQVTVEFLDENHYVTETIYSNFKRGGIKNPFDISVMGVACIGDGKYKSGANKKPTQSYHMWMNMLQRCYGEKCKSIYPAYYEVTEVCQHWLNFQNFAQWFEENKYEVDGRLHLDKDILFPGNKIYSPYHCLLVPQRINMLFMNRTNDNGLPNGVRRAKERYSASYGGSHIGTYDTLEEAYQAYSKVKECAIKQIADEYKAVIPTKLYDILYKYKCDIRFDKNYIAA